MRYSKKIFAHDRVVIAINADKDKYLNYETSTSGNTIGNVYVYCQESKRLDSFGVLKKLSSYGGGYTRVRCLELMPLKENPSLKLLVGEAGQFLAYCVGKTLAVDKTYRHFSGY